MAVCQFSHFRQIAIHQLVANAPGRNLPLGDYFHNGSELLPEVKSWHEYLRYLIRRNDTITGQVLDLIENGMLRDKPEQRHTAAQVGRKLTEILQIVSNDPTTQLEPMSALWSRHRDTIAIAEQEMSQDERMGAKPSKAFPRQPTQTGRTHKAPVDFGTQQRSKTTGGKHSGEVHS
jgi:hypothetical protein